MKGYGVMCLIIGMLSSPVLGMTAPSAVFFLRPEDTRNVQVSFAGSLFGQHGDMTYAIQGPQDGGWKSELEWPIKNMVYGGGVISTAFGDRFSLNVGGWKSLTKNSGTMTDRDWFDDLRALFLAIYDDDTAIFGEFDTTFDAVKFDGNLRFEFLRRAPLTLGVMAGYAYTQFYWETGDGYQHSPLPSYNIGAVTGAGITYKQRISTPYLGLSVSLIPEAVSTTLNLYAVYSPIAKCTDLDDHLARQKENTGSTSGNFLSLGSDIHLRVNSSWGVTATVNYATYDLEGSQDQVFYGGTNAGTRFYNIDMTVTGSQLSLGFLASYNF